MKRTWNLGLVVALVLALATFGVGCFGDNGDAGEGDVFEPEPDTADPDTGDESDVEVYPYENEWELILLVDSPDNTTDTCNAGNPGADIDAVEVYRDMELYAWAASVEFIEQTHETPCEENDKDDPEDMLGPADGQAADGVFEGYFSMNGRSVGLLLSDLLEDGDELVIYEMFNAENPDATIEDYQVYLGYYLDDGDMAFNDEAFADWNTGTVTGTIDGLW